MHPTLLLTLLVSLSMVYSIPCPRECICRPIDTSGVRVTQMSYLMNCSNMPLINGKLVYEAEEWSTDVDQITADNDNDDMTNDYAVSIDLSNSPSLKKFTNKTIDLKGFFFSIESLSLANQGDKFLLAPNAFYTPAYENLQVLNLSACCQQIPKQCPQLFQPLVNLQVLDLSRSNMYQTCLNTPDPILPSLRDLILRHNVYDAKTFSHSSELFTSVRMITGKLDLRNSLFQYGSKLTGHCLFDQFQSITSLDLSNVQFESISNSTDVHLTHLLRCKNPKGQQLLQLSLRALKLQSLPTWFTTDRFPLLTQLDLSENYIHAIDLQSFTSLRHIALAYNPIEFGQIIWRNDTLYDSINLRSTVRHSTFDLSRHLIRLLELTTDIDYSENEGETAANITQIPVGVQFITNRFSLNLSRANVETFQIGFKDITRLDVSWNYLTELTLNEQIKLRYLDCSNQYSQNLTLSLDLTELEELKCSNNSLTKIGNFHSSNKDKLEVIDLAYNSIESLKELFSDFDGRYLRTVNLKGNLIRTVQSYTFHDKLVSLFEIDLSGNQINKIKKFAFQAPNLQILDLTGNPLKMVEPRAIFTASLRFFSVFNNTHELTERCKQTKSNDPLLFMYVNWYKQNGSIVRNSPIKWSKCLTSYVREKKIDRIIKKSKQVFGFYALYVAIGVSLLATFFGGMHYYRKNGFSFLRTFRRYKKLDRQGLVENATEMDSRQKEEDEIVMDMEGPPFNKYSNVRTNV